MNIRGSLAGSLSRSSLMKEINNLRHSSPEPFGRTKEARKRRDITNIRVLFSQHLDVDVIKQQKKTIFMQGQKVLITRNTKPGQDILANLVKAVHGLAVERLGRSVLKDEKFPDDLLILSCEEDYDVCVPFLEKGGSVYSSELLLNGIVIQKLEYER
ncbi:hypothetical protein BUALT_Bualt19G0120700 [Buddleja alternifolia]|uniref:BRCT domain-containing protein n=1 Tax=Buddleja alternifolia TaxID=168488 RepID=A0AAV6WBR6_9LAMI|nr:hypothetical protein BUALT_Bualt19G0120700 [Buddleja alternifolia]